MDLSAFKDLKERKKIWDFWGLDPEVMLLVPYDVYLNLTRTWQQIGSRIFDFDFVFLKSGYHAKEWKEIRGFYHTLSQVGITINKHILYELIVYFFAVTTRRRNWEILAHEMIETTSAENFSDVNFEEL